MIFKYSFKNVINQNLNNEHVNMFDESPCKIKCVILYIIYAYYCIAETLDSFQPKLQIYYIYVADDER